MNLIILGPQGSGKGTQAKFLADQFDLTQIETGLALRQAAEEDTPLGRELHRIMYEDGGLVSDEETMKVLGEKLKRIPKERGVILDGAPRRLEQIKLVEDVMEKSGRAIDGVIFLNVSEEESIHRISRRYHCSKCHKNFFLGEDLDDPEKGCPVCGGTVKKRKDDTEEGVRKRLSVFHNETCPVVEYYREKGVLIEINGMKGKKEVFGQILDKIKNS